VADFSVCSQVRDDHVAIVEFERGEANFFSQPLIAAIADELERLAGQGQARAAVLCSAGRHFCAGADFSRDSISSVSSPSAGGHLYDAAIRLFEQPLPLVACVQGGAIGGGLGLALACDFRVASRESRFAAPFARLGLHHGFGLSVTLPLVVGHQRALDLLYTGRRVSGEEAYRIGLCDALADAEQLRQAAAGLAGAIAASAPLAVQSMRRTMRGHLPAEVRLATEREKAEQAALAATADHAEGVAASLGRRDPVFQGA
jgi:enoyl-CoA hydratase/carnithine racemase